MKALGKMCIYKQEGSEGGMYLRIAEKHQYLKRVTIHPTAKKVTCKNVS